MESRKQPPGLSIVGIKGEEFFEGCGRPAIFAGVHVRDRFFEECAFLAIADDTPLISTQGCFLVRFLGGSLVGPHVINLSRS
jgi:hypothetical protein